MDSAWNASGGNVGKIIHETIHLTYADGVERNVNIYLPRNYDRRVDERFPVLYMHDGQNLYLNHDSYQGISWGVKQAMENAEREGRTDGVIVVGIENDGDTRMYEYSPFPFDMLGTIGDDTQVYGATYVDYIVQELKPWVDENFRTLAGPETTWMCGSSAGANITFYAGMTYPEVFSKLGLFSTALWLFNQDDLRAFLYEAVRDEEGNLREGMAQIESYIYVGTEEGYGDHDDMLSQAYLDASTGLTLEMIKAGLSVDQVRLAIAYGRPHHESAWRQEFPRFLSFLLSE